MASAMPLSTITLCEEAHTSIAPLGLANILQMKARQIFIRI